jgi:hypothetical protein
LVQTDEEDFVDEEEPVRKKKKQNRQGEFHDQADKLKNYHLNILFINFF